MMTTRTCHPLRGLSTPTGASGRATFCRTRRMASALLRPPELRPGVGGSGFLETDPVEGGSANDFDYVAGDPINAKDLTGTRVCVDDRCKNTVVLRKGRSMKLTKRYLRNCNWQCQDGHVHMPGGRSAGAIGYTHIWVRAPDKLPFDRFCRQTSSGRIALSSTSAFATAVKWLGKLSSRATPVLAVVDVLCIGRG
jgi:hypothetical protein